MAEWAWSGVQEGLAEARTRGPPSPQSWRLVYDVICASDATVESANKDFTAAGESPRWICAPTRHTISNTSTSAAGYVCTIRHALLTQCIFQLVKTSTEATSV